MFTNKAAFRLKQMGFNHKAEIKSVSLYKFPDVVLERAKKVIGCNDEEFELVKLSLLGFFNAVKYTEGLVEMTDKDADELWHVFLLDTRAYMEFCAEYIGFYLHHSPYISEKQLSHEDMKNIAIKHGNAIDQDADLYSLMEIKTLNTSKENIEKYLPFFSLLLTKQVSYNGYKG